MEFFLVLLGAAYLIGLPVAVIVLLVQMSGVKARLAGLEARGPKPASAAPPEPVPEPVAKTPAPAPIPASAPKAAAQIAAPVAPPGPTPDQNQPLVIRRDRFAALADWVRGNWVLVIAALSLALAGVFFVQYGVEHGLLPPGLRVLAGLGFGLGLVGVGEWMRRRHGDRGDHSTLPQVFSGAGLVSAFAAVTAARLMYGLIGAELAFAGQVAIAALGVGLGWVNGPMLAAVGLLGAAASPFLVGGGAAPQGWLYAYYALVAVTGLLVDAYRRWAWLSVLALVLGYGGSWLMAAAGGPVSGWLALLAALPVLATALPVLRLVPDHPAPGVLSWLARGGVAPWPVFPVRLAAGSLLASTLGLVQATTYDPGTAMLAFGLMAGLALLYLLWTEGAEGLADLGLLPAAGFLAGIALGGSGTPLAASLAGQAIALRPPETPPPLELPILLALAALVSLAFAARALRPGPLPLVMGLGAGLAAPMTAAGLELFWQPALHLGPYPWALMVLGVAALMTFFATRLARADGEDRRRTAHASLSALSLVALALFILTTSTALTLALSALVVVAAALDRRFRLPEMGLFIQIALAVISFRLVVNPGIDEIILAGPEVSILPALLAFGGAIAAALAARALIAGMGRVLTEGALLSVAATLGAVLANVLIYRRIILGGGHDPLAHWALALQAMPWLVLALAQIYRAGLGGPVWIVRARWAIAVLAGLLAAGGMMLAVLIANPLFHDRPLVIGLPFLNSLALAYGLPGIALLAAALRLPMPRWMSGAMTVSGAGLLALYAGLSIRHLWQGANIGPETGFLQAEVYSYTLALLLTGAGLLWRAIARRSALLRRVAMGVIGLTIAKVFLIDIAGLSGLVRVASFLGLGLSLAGLAWLNRWAGREISGPEDR